GGRDSLQAGRRRADARRRPLDPQLRPLRRGRLPRHRVRLPGDRPGGRAPPRIDRRPPSRRDPAGGRHGHRAPRPPSPLSRKEPIMTINQTAQPNANKALWERGDFTRIAATMRGSGEALVGSLGITRGLDVLDLGSGDGTTAIPAAELGADVLAVDIASNLVAAGSARAQSLRLRNVTFQEGDAADLNELDDDSFDLVVTIFGAMFATSPNDVAKEIVRVTRPGGRIVMGNWIPGDPTLVAQILRISSAYSPPPPEGFV